MEDSNTKSIMISSAKRQLIDNYKTDKNKKRVEAEKWTFDKNTFSHENQINIIKNIKNNIFVLEDYVTKIAVQQINKKIYGYKQQDKIKKTLDEAKFLNFESVIRKMIECELKCRYCKSEMNVLYDISREMKQWSVDRIDNDVGHNMDNFHLACLDCNLKRRRRTDEKFLFTKQLNIVKV